MANFAKWCVTSRKGIKENKQWVLLGKKIVNSHCKYFFSMLWKIFKGTLISAVFQEFLRVFRHNFGKQVGRFFCFFTII